jgi:hypothetical protein
MSFFFYAFRSVKFPNLRYKGKTVETQYIRKRGVKPGTKPGLREDLARHAEGKPELSDGGKEKEKKKNNNSKFKYKY